MNKRSVRKWLSYKRAVGGLLFGRPTGFFTQYGFMDSVRRVELYPAVEQRCRAVNPARVLMPFAVGDAAFADDPFWAEETRHLGRLDAALNYSVIRAFRPNHILEIGCGRSTQILARALIANGDGATITCIDPAPRLDIGDLPIEFHRRTLRPDDVDLAAELRAGDVLYIDSSHILQPGTDVDLQFNLMLPALAPGVIVHVHDIFLPWGYPPEWAVRGWNEVSGLIPWICSDAFEIVFPSHYMARERRAELERAAPRFMAGFSGAMPGSIWLRKRTSPAAGPALT